MICPRERSSPAAATASACRVNAAYTATPWATGNNPVRIVIASGAGRRLTRRSASAFAIRATNPCGSSR